MNCADLSATVRLLPGAGRSLAATAGRLKPFLEKNGIRTVLIRGGRTPEGALRLARRLRGEFDAVLECEAAGLRSLAGTMKRFPDIGLAAALDIMAPAAELREAISVLEARPGPAVFFMKNGSGSAGEAEIHRACAVIMREVGGRDVKFHWDCRGFPLCAFTEAELGFFIANGSPVSCSCPGLATIDEELNIDFCGGARPRRPAGRALPGVSLTELRKRFGDSLRLYRSFGDLARCVSCPRAGLSCRAACPAAVKESFR